MSIHAEDPLLTAYALGDLDEAARSSVETALASDPALQGEVDAIRALAGRLEEAFASEEPATLLAAQRSAVLAAARAPARRWLRLVPIATAAAAVLLVGVVALLQLPARIDAPAGRAEETAARSQEHPFQAPYAEQGPVPSRAPSVLRVEFDDGGAGGLEEGLAREVGFRGPGGQVPPVRLEPSNFTPPPPSGPPAVNGLVVLGGRLADEPAGFMLPDSPPPADREAYAHLRDNPFVRVTPTQGNDSTFSIDVDTASYANVRRMLLREGRMPPPGAVRLEELINYFDYAYAPPAADAAHPFAAHTAVAACPWEPRHRLVRVALKGKVIERGERPVSNLVFLVDVSGSMNSPDKLPLLVEGLKLLVGQLDERDRVAIAVYAGAAGLVLPSTAGTEKATILAALDRLRAGGSTAGAAGIELAYRTAAEHFVEGGVNRVILATDGDFNVGTTDEDSLVRLIQEKAKGGVFLTVLGFGRGNYQDARMEALSNHGNGNYAYVDSLQEARRVFVDQLAGTLVTIAKDVKVQVFFNPATVAAWRLIGYENRLLARQDFDDDRKDAGEIGAGHAVTALYEIVPAGGEVEVPAGVENPFVEPARLPEAASGALLRLRLRYKQPDGDTSTLLEQDVLDDARGLGDADPDFQWAGAVAAFGMLLRDSPHRGLSTYEMVLEIAQAARGPDAGGLREEFLRVVRRAAQLSRR